MPLLSLDFFVRIIIPVQVKKSRIALHFQAITNADLLIIPKEKIESLGESSINWMKFQKIIAELQYIELENRIFLLQKEKASLRYEVLLKSHPEFIKHIPLNYLASYLGITQRHLSRLRKELVY